MFFWLPSRSAALELERHDHTRRYRLSVFNFGLKHEQWSRHLHGFGEHPLRILLRFNRRNVTLRVHTDLEVNIAAAHVSLRIFDRWIRHHVQWFEVAIW